MSILVDEGDWAEAERGIEAIVADDPDMTVYQVTAGPHRVGARTVVDGGGGL